MMDIKNMTIGEYITYLENEVKKLRNKIKAQSKGLTKVRYCKRCEKEFTFKHWNKKYCSDKCRQKAWEERTGKQLIKGKKKS